MLSIFFMVILNHLLLAVSPLALPDFSSSGFRAPRHPHLIEFAGLDILFLIRMMIFVGYLEEKRFFESLVNALFGGSGRDPRFW
jgi:Na+/H+ antiporter NhaD/arsenite permease-like protein